MSNRNFKFNISQDLFYGPHPLWRSWNQYSNYDIVGCCVILAILNSVDQGTKSTENGCQSLCEVLSISPLHHWLGSCTQTENQAEQLKTCTLTTSGDHQLAADLFVSLLPILLYFIVLLRWVQYDSLSRALTILCMLYNSSVCNQAVSHIKFKINVTCVGAVRYGYNEMSCLLQLYKDAVK